jgi:hypothetical protein
MKGNAVNGVGTPVFFKPSAGFFYFADHIDADRRYVTARGRHVGQ